jgi:hypothetical protein
MSVSGATTEFLNFFNTLKELGIKVLYDENEILIKGRLEHVDLDAHGVSNILINQNGFEIEYIKSDKFMSILIWKYDDGERKLVKSISVDGVLTVRFSRPYLYIRYSDIYEIKKNVEYVDGFDEAINYIRNAGFDVEFYPEKRELRIKGETEAVFSFIDPRVRAVLSSCNSELVLFRDNKEYRLKVVEGYHDIEFVIGDVKQTEVELDGQYLIIRYPAVKVLPY